MKPYSCLVIFINFLFGLISYGQDNEIHPCSVSRTGRVHSHGEKTLTVQEETLANKYDVTYCLLDLNMTNQNTTVSGTATIYGKVLEDLDSVILELFPTLSITEIRVNGLITGYNRTNSILKVELNQLSGTSFIIEIDYNGIPPTPANNPFGGSGVTNANLTSIGSKITYSVSCPFLAHEWLPCKQILRDKIDSSSVILTVPEPLIATSNGVLESVSNLGNGYLKYTWKNSRPILYYLICATVAPYTEYTLYAHPTALAGDSVKVQNFLYGTTTSLPQAQAQCDLLPGFIEYFSDRYGLYPFPEQKYGLSLAPLSGGMEHQTMTTVGVMEKKITAHELAHQWWGDYVGIASFSDVWLSEGFATYSEYVMLENFYPNEKGTLLSSWHSSVFSAAGGSIWHTDTLNISRIYNSRLTYKKGASIIHTLRHIVNNDVLFFQTMRDFLDAYQDSVALGTDLIQYFENSTGIPLVNYANEWYFGEGYPTYSAIWNTVGNDVHLQVDHITSMPAVTPTFTNPLEVRFSRSGMTDTIIRLNISDNSDQFYLTNLGPVTDLVTFDPSNWIINKTGTIVHDPSFVASTFSIDNTRSYTIFPNPATDQIMISDLMEEGKLILLDPNGKTIMETLITPGASIDVGRLAPGWYVAEFSVGGQFRRSVLIIK